MALQQKMKILIHQPRLSYYIGGGEVIPLLQAEALSSFGHQIEILTSRGPKFSPIFNEFCRRNPQIKIHYLELDEKDKKIYHQVPGKNWSRWDKESILFGEKAVPFYLNHFKNWDLVITHLLSDSFYIPKSFKNILHLHGAPTKTRKLDNQLLKRPDGFIAVANFVRKEWLRLYPYLKRKKIAVCYNGIKTKNFPNLKLKRNIDLLFVGRLLKNKGLKTILQSLRLLTIRGVKFNKLIIVGHGPEERNIKKLLKKFNLNKKVKLIGSVSPKKLLNLYNQAKIFLCPSIAKEGVLTTMLEAASCGAAIVTTDCCGMIEFAKNGINSLLVKPADSRDLAQKIELLLTNSYLRQRLSTQAQKQVRQSWDIQQLGKKLNQIYLNFLKYAL